ncbi:hypothetical protein ACFL12_04100 [Pseudomonadota bacterium]
MQTIVAHLHAQRCNEAIALWHGTLAGKNKCTDCFYEEVAEDVRCATCLDGHLAHAQLQRTYPVFGEDDLTRAKQELADCFQIVKST